MNKAGNIVNTTAHGAGTGAWGYVAYSKYGRGSGPRHAHARGSRRRSAGDGGKRHATAHGLAQHIVFRPIHNQLCAAKSLESIILTKYILHIMRHRARAARPPHAWPVRPTPLGMVAAEGSHAPAKSATWYAP